VAGMGTAGICTASSAEQGRHDSRRQASKQALAHSRAGQPPSQLGGGDTEIGLHYCYSAQCALFDFTLHIRRQNEIAHETPAVRVCCAVVVRACGRVCRRWITVNIFSTCTVHEFAHRCAHHFPTRPPSHMPSGCPSQDPRIAAASMHEMPFPPLQHPQPARIQIQIPQPVPDAAFICLA
jgi:hypothetical protein